jgi:hypothetical protein
MYGETILWATVVCVGLLAWGLISLWNLTGLSGELGMLVFWIIFGALVIGVGGRVGWWCVRTVVHWWIRQSLKDGH